jgi:hypothetical protein
MDPNTDPFRPPAIPSLVHCIHCNLEYESYLIEWRESTGADGKTQGFWCCPMPGCDGIGFGFDIFPVDPEYRDERGGWFADDDESVNDLIHPDEDEPSENKLPIDEKRDEEGNEDVPF